MNKHRPFLFATSLMMAALAMTAGGDAPLKQKQPPIRPIDFTRRMIAWEDELSGGPLKDGIPTIDEPSFGPVAAAWLSDRIIVFVEAGDSHLARDCQ